MYQFSVPMPYTKQDITKLIEINKQIKKSKITSFYFSLPASCELFTGFEQYRNFDLKHNNLEYWIDLVKYSMGNNIDIIYLLNRTNINFQNDKHLQYCLNKLDKLLNKISDIGITKLRLADSKLISYIHNKYPHFILSLSTSSEYKYIGEYRNIIKIHPYIKEIVPSHDNNKNFLLLSNLTKSNSNTEIELMINEGCIKFCPLRIGHHSISDININKKNFFSNTYYIKTFCGNEKENDIIKSLIFSNIVYPWELEEYKKIGITKFKLTGRDVFTFRINNLLSTYFYYLKGIDNKKNIENIPINMLTDKFFDYPKLRLIKVKEIIKYLPDIKHFKKYGHLCSSQCGFNCHYCYKCVEKAKKCVKQKEKKEEIEIKQFCIIK